MPFEVTVKCQDGKLRKFEVESTTTVLDLLELMEEKTGGIPIAQMRIVSVGRSMDNDKTLGDYGIGPDSTKEERKMHCIIILR